MRPTLGPVTKQEPLAVLVKKICIPHRGFLNGRAVLVSSATRAKQEIWTLVSLAFSEGLAKSSSIRNGKEENMKLFASILLAAGTVAMTSATRALPISPVPSVPSAIVQAGWACGPGWHLTPWGRCVPTRRFYRPWGYWGRPRFYAPRPFWRPWPRPGYWRRW